MHFSAIIQARMGSKRLPGKVLRDIGPHKLLEHIFQRLRKAEIEDYSITLAIPDEPESAQLEELARKWKVGVYYGSEKDVLSRYLGASSQLKDTDYIVRLTGDNPFPDIPAFNSMANRLIPHPVDYAYPLGLPLGMGFEFVRVNALRSQEYHALLPHHREHVTTFIRENPHLYEEEAIPAGPFVSYQTGEVYPPEIRLTVDEPADLTMAIKVFDHFARIGNPWFGSRDVSGLYARLPDFFADNLHVEQKSALSHE